ncbi:MAG TPA: protein kinase, partial [Kofleriaceae bacterium]|nr:protein kinase [Kofleriaceae bacterium]
MVHPSSECLADELVMELVQGRLPDDTLRGVEEHIAACRDCRLVVAETAAAEGREVTGPTRPHLALPHRVRAAAAPLAGGTRVGRYQVRELIGVGGIGAVYAAHDPALERLVALKVLRSDGMDSASGPGGDLRARLLREARAMAQLNHPNVVMVHDAGTFEDRVFLAMELVDGTTLRRWLEGRGRSTEEVLAAFRAAGEGLAAAHRIGLVHRDFKPENVLVGEDGRVRVTDFGLARPANGEGTGTHQAIGAARPTWSHATLTRTGVMAGTPAYMAPEQYVGEAPDQRTDQFSFCVALYEALYGQRPFAGESLDDMADSVIHGRMRPPPGRSQVPAGLRAAILRGLEVDRDARFPSMAALLAAMAAVPVARPAARRRPVIAAAAGAVVL